MFEGVDFFNKEKRGGDLGAGRIKSYFNPGNVFLVHVNKTQLNDPKYGTKRILSQYSGTSLFRVKLIASLMMTAPPMTAPQSQSLISMSKITSQLRRIDCL